jgi:VanZ family protein
MLAWRVFRQSAPWSWLFLLWWACSLLLSSLSGPQLADIPFAWNDKVMHLVYFSLGGFFLAQAWIKFSLKNGAQKRILSTHLWAVPLVIMLLSMIDETYQLFTPGRSGADIGDFIADTIGGVCGTVASAAARRLAFR